MQALILAGGRGTRLGDLTHKTPKPMVDVGGKPFLEWLLELLLRHKICDFIFCVGHLSEKIIKHFGNGEKWGCRIQYSVEGKLLGTGGAIKKASGLIRDSFFVFSGDNYLPLNYTAFMKLFELKRPLGLLACWHNDPPLFRSNILLDLDSKKIEAYDFHNDSDKNYVDMGVKLFSTKLLTYFPPQDSFSLEIDVMGRLAEEGLLTGFPVNNPALDVGTPEMLELTRRQLRQAPEFI